MSTITNSGPEYPSSLWGEIQPLTTAWTAPAGCPTFVERLDKDDDKLYDYDCAPPNFHKVWYLDGYYSPAVCPQDYTTATTVAPGITFNYEVVGPDQTAILCVPSGYTLAIDSSSGTSSLRAREATTRFPNQPSNLPSSLAVRTRIPAIQIRFEASDLAALGLASASSSPSPSSRTPSNSPSSRTSSDPSTSPTDGSSSGANAPSTDPAPSSSSSAISPGAIAGIVVGAILAFALGFALAFFYIRRRQRQLNTAAAHPGNSDGSELEKDGAQRYEVDAGGLGKPPPGTSVAELSGGNRYTAHEMEGDTLAALGAAEMESPTQHRGALPAYEERVAFSAQKSDNNNKGNSFGWFGGSPGADDSPVLRPAQTAVGVGDKYP